MQQSQKLDGILRGPIHSTFAFVIQGLVTLRAFDRVGYFKQDFNNTLEKCANATFVFNSTSRWVSLRLDMICVVFSVATIAIGFAQKGHVQAELLILSIQSMTDVISGFSVSLRMYAEFDNFMTSPQRLYQYSQLPLEAALERDIDKNLKDLNWPTKGDVEFNQVTMKYREGLEPSINKLDVKIKAGMQVGIVGRTGAGKSSILQALFRLVELSEGDIRIDETNLRDIGLHQLRKNIAFIPQSPFLLQGTIRENLDPFKDCTDAEIE